MPERILLLTSPDVAASLCTDCVVVGLEFAFAASQEEAVRVCATRAPRVVLVEPAAVGALPELGWAQGEEEPFRELCRFLRELGRGQDASLGAVGDERGAVVVALVPRDQPHLTVWALEMGADDCLDVATPPRELVARIRAWTRRSGRAARTEQTLERIAVGALSVELGVGRRARVDGRTVSLSPREHALLVALMRRPGAVCRRSELSQEVWGREAGAGSRTLDVHIGRLRSKIEADPRHPQIISTVAALGYRLEAPGQALDLPPPRLVLAG